MLQLRFIVKTEALVARLQVVRIQLLVVHQLEHFAGLL